MQKNFVCVVSNSMDKLADLLLENLYHEETSPFKRRVLLVPSAAIKSYLQERIARSQHQISSGLQISLISQAWNSFFERDARYQNMHRPSLIELSLVTQYYLHDLFSKWETEENKELFGELISYFDLNEKEMDLRSIKYQARIVDFSVQVAQMFLECEKWDKTDLIEGWQKEIYRRVLGNKRISDGKSLLFLEPKDEVHLFHCQFLTEKQLQFFEKCDAVFYQYSPCALYWEDSRSDKERTYALQMLEKKKHDRKELEKWNEYVKDTNMLLANFGKAGREMWRRWHDETLVYDFYENYKEGVLSILPSIQRSVLELETGEEKKKTLIDSSFQVHVATSAFRELEICKDTLLNLVVDSDDLTPKDIVVMAPSMEKYAPFIPSVFGDFILSFTLEDTHDPAQNHFYEGVKAIFALGKNSFQKEDLLKLFNCQNFLNKFFFSDEECKQIIKWLKKMDFSLGWRKAIRQLILGWMMDPNESFAKYDDNWIPPIFLTEEETDLLQRWITLLNGIEIDLEPITSQKKLSLSKWIELITKTITSHFVIENDAEEDLSYLHRLSWNLKEEDGEYFVFTRVESLLDSFHKKKKTFFSSDKNAIRFCRFDFGCAPDAKVVYLLGMDEESFPSKQQDQFLIGEDLFKDVPRKADVERFLFLETLMMTRKHFITSYVRISEKDGKPQEASLPVKELLSFCKENFSGEKDEDLSVALIKEHPNFSFDKAYFTNELSSLSTKAYEMALAHYVHPKREKMAFFNAIGEVEREITIDLQDLRKLARHPVQFYCNKSLGLYLSSPEKQRLSPSFQDYAYLRKTALDKPIEDVLKIAKAKGILTDGMWREVIEKKICEEVEEYLQGVDQLQIDRQKIFSVYFQKGVKEPELKNKTWILPACALSIEGVPYTIVGKMGDVTEEGLLFHGEEKMADLVKIWPLYLTCLAHPFFQGKKFHLLLSKDKPRKLELNVDAEEYLKRYIRYYQKSMETPSFLMPLWVDAIGMDKNEKLAKQIDESSDTDAIIPDEYLMFLQKRNDLPDPKEVCANWKDSVLGLFFPIWKEDKSEKV